MSLHVWVENALPRDNPFYRGCEYTLGVAGAVVLLHSYLLHGIKYDTVRRLTDFGALNACMIGLCTSIAYSWFNNNLAAKAILSRAFSEALFPVTLHMTDCAMFYHRYKAIQKISLYEKQYLFLAFSTATLSFLFAHIGVPFSVPFDSSLLSQFLELVAAVVQVAGLSYCSFRSAVFLYKILQSNRTTAATTAANSNKGRVNLARVLPLSLPFEEDSPAAIRPPTAAAPAAAAVSIETLLNLPVIHTTGEDGQQQVQQYDVNDDAGVGSAGENSKTEISQRPWARKLMIIANKNIVHAVTVLLLFLLIYLGAIYGNIFNGPMLLMVKLLDMHLLFNWKSLDNYFCPPLQRQELSLSRPNRELFVMWLMRKQYDEKQNRLARFVASFSRSLQSAAVGAAAAGTGAVAPGVV